MKKLEFHPASGVFRLLDGAEFKALKDSIEKFGQQVSIKTLDGKILDGRNRYNVCLALGIDPWLEAVSKSDLEGMSPLDYVRAMNQDRRHDDPGQRALAAARIKEYYEIEARERQTENLKKGREIPVMANLPQRENGSSRDKAGEAMGVSGKTVDAAVKVLHNSPPEIIEAVEHNEVSVSDAAAVATLPKPKQKRALKKVKSGKAKTLKAAAEPHERNGKQKHDPRLFERLKTQVGGCLRAVDDLNRSQPAPKFHREVVGYLNAAVSCLDDWRKAVR